MILPFSTQKTEKHFAFPFEKRGNLSVCLLLEGCANGIGIGVCIAGADIDLLCDAGAGAVVVNAVCHIAGNAGVGVAGLAGSFVAIVVVHSLEYPFKFYKFF